MYSYVKIHGQPTVFLEIIRAGEKRGFPPCCSFAYAKDIINGNHPENMRGRYSTEHVPCDECSNLLYDWTDFEDELQYETSELV
jgi:hypothetical protein